ncbi:MAG: pilus assembly protein N-terminal domain-containing protein [Ahrensia sp.]
MFLRSTTKLMAVFAVASTTAFTGVAHSADYAVGAEASLDANISVSLNHARIIKLSRPAATVIIGNPEIADATVRDSQTIVLTGRGFGNTNMVILDATGTPIIDERIAVSRNEFETLKVYRRADIETLSCKPFCERAYLTEAETQSIRATAEANSAGDDDS